MNAIVRLTAHDLKRVREELFQRKRRDRLWLAEALGNYRGWHDAYLADDPIEIKRRMDTAVWNYLEETGELETAESESQLLKELS